ncbi:MAG: ABC transporter substrate-binding protein [candidate division KSB1 bacterium]|nr:ABC transporter substrate-binding protein [candidate division KSB1 bacterium]
MTKRNLWITIGAVVVIAAVIAGIRMISKPAPEEQVIKMGAILPLTGNAASYGVEEQKGMMIAVSEINESGGLIGRKMRVQYEDSKGSTQEALNALRKLRNGGISIIFTSLTGPSKAIKPIAEREGFLQIIYGMTDDLPQDAANVFRIYPSLSEEGDSFVKYARTRRPKRVGVLYLDNVAFDYLVSRVLEPGLRESGIQDLVKETFTADKVEGVKSAIQRIKGSKVEMIFIAAYYNYIAAILKEIRVQNLFGTAEIVGGLDVPVAVFTLRDFDPTLAEGVVCAVPKFMLYLSDSSYAGDEARRFLTAYKSRYKSLPTYDAAYGYDAVMLLAEAIRKAGNTHVENLRTHLTGLAIDKAAGRIIILEDGNSQTEWLLAKLQNGKLVVIE